MIPKEKPDIFFKDKKIKVTVPKPTKEEMKDRILNVKVSVEKVVFNQYQQQEIECIKCKFDFNASLEHFETLNKVRWGEDTKIICPKCETENIITTDYFWLDGGDEYEQVIVRD